MLLFQNPIIRIYPREQSFRASFKFYKRTRNIEFLKDVGFSSRPYQRIPYYIASLREMASRKILEKYFDSVFSSCTSQSILILPILWVFLSSLIFWQGSTELSTLFTSTVGWDCVQASKNHLNRFWGLL